MMKHYRYKKLSWKIKLVLAVPSLICLEMAFSSLVMRQYLLAAVSVILFLGFFCYAHDHFFEHFTFQKNQIFVRKLLYKDEIEFPEKISLIISYGAIGSPHIYYGLYNDNGIKGIYGVTILREMLPEKIIAQLHARDEQNKRYYRSWRGRYTNRMVAGYFDGYYHLYDCFLSEELLKELYTLRPDATIIVPASLVGSYDLPFGKVYIDEQS